MASGDALYGRVGAVPSPPARSAVLTAVAGRVPGDRSTGVVSGDGAGAALIGAGGPGDPGGLPAFDLGSDGTGYGQVTVEGGGSRARSLPGPAAEGDQYVRMRGQTVYQHAVERMTGSCRSLPRTVGWNADQVDHFVPHQANGRIPRSVAERPGIAEERCVVPLDRVGNTGAASLPCGPGGRDGARAVPRG